MQNSINHIYPKPPIIIGDTNTAADLKQSYLSLLLTNSNANCLFYGQTYGESKRNHGALVADDVDGEERSIRWLRDSLNNLTRMISNAHNDIITQRSIFQLMIYHHLMTIL